MSGLYPQVATSHLLETIGSQTKVRRRQIYILNVNDRAVTLAHQELTLNLYTFASTCPSQWRYLGEPGDARPNHPDENQSCQQVLS